MITDMSTDQILQHKHNNSNDVTNLYVKKTNKVSNAPQDSSKKEEMDTDKKNKETSASGMTPKVIETNLKENLIHDNDVTMDTNKSIVKSVVEEEEEHKKGILFKDFGLPKKERTLL
jgi:hypothetical protein